MTIPSWNCEWRSWLRCRATLADGKLWVKTGGAATFIDFHIQRLQVFGILLSDLFYSGIVRLEDFDIRSAICGYCFSFLSFFGWCVVERVSKRRGNGISGFCGWQWRINEKGRFWGLIDTTTGRWLQLWRKCPKFICNNERKKKIVFIPEIHHARLRNNQAPQHKINTDWNIDFVHCDE